jgi:sorting nexin-1/2
VKTAFTQRQKSYHAWHAAESELVKRKSAQEKLLRQGRSQQDKISQMSAEVGDAERKVHQARLLFEDMGRLMHTELDRFEREKVEDFKSGVETFLEGGVEAQKEVSVPIVDFGSSGLCIGADARVAHRNMGDVPHAAGRRRR